MRAAGRRGSCVDDPAEGSGRFTYNDLTSRADCSSSTSHWRRLGGCLCHVNILCNIYVIYIFPADGRARIRQLTLRHWSTRRQYVFYVASDRVETSGRANPKRATGPLRGVRSSFQGQHPLVVRCVCAPSGFITTNNDSPVEISQPPGKHPSCYALPLCCLMRAVHQTHKGPPDSQETV